MSSVRCGLQIIRDNRITSDYHNHPRWKQMGCLLSGTIVDDKESKLTNDVVDDELQDQIDDKMDEKKEMAKEGVKPKTMEGSGVLDLLRSIPIRGVIEKGAAKLSNLFPSGDENARNIYPGEYHALFKLPKGGVGRANYAGPGTQIVKRIKRGDPPRVPTDQVAQAHDLRYSLARGGDDVRKADVKMVRSLKSLQRENKDSQFNIKPSMRIIQAKMQAENFGLASRDKFISSDTKMNRGDENLLRGKLRELEQKGYGRLDTTTGSNYTQQLAKAGSSVHERVQVDRRRNMRLADIVGSQGLNTKGAFKNRRFQSSRQTGSGQHPGQPAGEGNANVYIQSGSGGWPGTRTVNVHTGAGYKRKRYPGDKLLRKMHKKVKSNKKGRLPLYMNNDYKMAGYLAKKMAPLVMAR